MATVATNTVDIKQLPQIESIASQDLLLIETNNGTNTIQTQNVVWSINNTDFGQTHANAIVSLSSSLASAQLAYAINNATQTTATLPSDLFAVTTTASPAGARSIQKKNIVWDITNTSFGEIHAAQISALSAESLEARFETLPYALSGLQPTDEFIINTNNGVAQIQAVSIIWPKAATDFGQDHEDRLESIESVLLTSDSTIGVVLNYDTGTHILEATSAINTFDIKPQTVFGKNIVLSNSNAAVTSGAGSAVVSFEGYGLTYYSQLGHQATSGASNPRHTFIENSNIAGTSTSRFATFTTDANGLSNARVALLGTHNAPATRPIQFFGSTDTQGSSYLNGSVYFDKTGGAGTNRNSTISFNSGHNLTDPFTRTTRIRFAAFDAPSDKWDELNLESNLGDTDTNDGILTPFISGKRRTTGNTNERRRSYIGIGAYPDISQTTENITVGGVTRIDKSLCANLSYYDSTLQNRPSLTVNGGTELNGGLSANGGITAPGTITTTTIAASTGSFSGNLSAATVPRATNNTTVATTAYVQDIITTKANPGDWGVGKIVYLGTHNIVGSNYNADVSFNAPGTLPTDTAFVTVKTSNAVWVCLNITCIGTTWTIDGHTPWREDGALVTINVIITRPN